MKYSHLLQLCFFNEGCVSATRKNTAIVKKRLAKRQYRISKIPLVEARRWLWNYWEPGTSVCYLSSHNWNIRLRMNYWVQAHRMPVLMITINVSVYEKDTDEILSKDSKLTHRNRFSKKRRALLNTCNTKQRHRLLLLWFCKLLAPAGAAFVPLAASHPFLSSAYFSSSSSSSSRPRPRAHILSRLPSSPFLFLNGL